MPTTSSQYRPTDSKGALPPTTQALIHRAASSRAAMYKLAVWATLGFVVLAVLNTAMGR